jgi:hypothetical protein
MTTAADRADEAAFEAVLAGRPVPAGAAGFAAFTEAVRATATQPGRPNAALAELLANGLIVDQPSPSARTAVRRRRHMWFFTAIIAKIASAGAVAQAATGAGIVLVGFTGAGAAGVLPGPVQETFTSVVSAVTGSDPAATAPSLTTPAATTSPAQLSTPTATSTATSTSAQATSTNAAPAAKTAEDADDDGKAHPSHPVNHGQQVSSEAHERNDERQAQRATASTSTESKSVSEDRDDSESKGQSGRGR